MEAIASQTPFRLLYNQLNGKISETEERTLRDFLRDSDPGIPTEDLGKLNTTSEIFLDLEQRGHIKCHDSGFLKTLLEEIDRTPLIDLINECEKKLASEQIDEDRGEQTGRQAFQGSVPTIGQLFSNQSHHIANGYSGKVYIRRFHDKDSASKVSSAVRRKIDQLKSDEDFRDNVSEILTEKQYQPVGSKDVMNFQENVISPVTEGGVMIAEAHQIPFDRSVIVTSRPDIVATK